MGVSLGVDISKLDVCFGGFAPTVMGDMTATWEKAVQAEARIAERKQAALLAARLEAARESELHAWTDEAGTVWEYVILDGADIRIKGCQPAVSVLHIPEAIEGHSVVELVSGSCAGLESVREVTVPDTVVAIGDCAFRGCVDLERVVLPAFISEYHADWFQNCKSLSHLTLPGALEVLTPRIFDQGSLKTLIIGEGTRDVRPGTFINSELESVQVSESNQFMTSDGRALYSKDWTIMAALAVPTGEYAVHEGCKVLGKKAMSGFANLALVSLPDSLEVIGEFAFAHTAVTSFSAPPRLRALLEKVFYGCPHLTQVFLNEGLEILGEAAFEDSGISQLHVPATVREIGPRIADGTRVCFRGDELTFSLEKGGSLFFDGQGGLYRESEQGLRFVRLMDAQAEEYSVLEGTIEIERQAFESARYLVTVHLPEGLKKIDGAAFRGCKRLTRVNVPPSVTWIGGDAFLDTSIEEVTLPGQLVHLGPRALITLGAHHGKGEPSLRRIELHAESERFRMHEGLLLERKDDGFERVVVYVGPQETVHVPDTVNEIAAYAFNGAVRIKELFLSDRITTVGARGLAVDALLEHIHVDMVQPVEGHGFFDIHPPRTDRSEQQMMLALTVPTFVNVEALFEYYDNSIINASSFDAQSESGLDTYEQANRLVDRLEDPVFMGAVSQKMARRVLRDSLFEICLESARHDDRCLLGRLVDLGILNASNIDDAVDAVQRMQDASMTGYLLELKRERFGIRSFDFSL